MRNFHSVPFFRVDGDHGEYVHWNPYMQRFQVIGGRYGDSDSPALCKAEAVRVTALAAELTERERMIEAMV